MPRKSMADQCSSGKGTKRSLRSQEESSASCSQSQAVSSASKRARSPQKPITKRSSSVTRSPILTRSRSKASALKNEQSGNCVVSPMDNPSRTPLDESLKRKNTSHSEQNSRGEGSGESQTKKSKSLRKHKKAKMSNNSTDSVEDLDNSGNPPTGNASDVTNNQNQTQVSTAQDPSTVWDLDTMEILRSGDSGDSLLSRMIEASVCPNDIVNNLKIDNEPRAPNPLDSIFSSNRLDTTHAPLANPEISQNENEIIPPDLSRLRYESMRNISERKLITKSEFQKSLLSAMQMQRSKNSPANSSKSSESQSDPRPGGSGTSELHNVLRIKVEKDADGSKETCKFSKPSNIRESVFKPLPSGSGVPPAGTFHSLAIKQEVDVPMSEEVSNPFLSRRIFMPDSLEGESSAQGSSSASAANGSDSIDGEIGRLQALMDSRRIPLTLFGALESRMQQLFQKSMGSATSSRAQQLLQELQAAEDDEHQLQVLIEISQLLVMGNEDTLIGFPVKQIVPLLINMLLKEYNFELMNQACRALTYLIEALPRSSSIVVEAIPVLLNKVEVIQCIDVAEQALTALKMLSKWHSKAILQAKGVVACLMHLDFFSINAQRTALAIIANCCQNILPHEFCLVQDSLNTLSGWLTHQDEKSVESICLAISGLVECFQNDRASLMQIGSNSLLTNIQQLLLMSPPIVSSQIFTAVIHMLALMCSNCSEIVVFLLKQNFARTLQYLLVNERRSKEDQIELVARSPQEYLELASLMCEIMPCLPPVELFNVNNLIVEAKRRVGLSNSVVWQWKDESGFWHSHDRNDSKVMEDAYQRGNMKQLYISSSRTALNVDLQAMEQFDEATGSPKQIRRHVIQPSEEQTKTSRGEFFSENSDLVISGIKVLFPVLFEMYCTSAGSTIKYKCLRAMIRMIYYAPPEDLDAVLKKQSIARHVASMLASQNFRTIISALQIAEILMQKLKNDFRAHFVREGVLHEIKKLAEIDPKTWQIDPEPSTSMSAHASMIPASMDLFGADMVLPSSSKSEPAAGQSSATAPSTSAPSVPIFGSSSQPSSSKDEESTATNVASKIRDALKRRYLNIKRSFGAGDKELSALYCSDASISNDNRIKINTWIRTQADALNEKYFNVLFTTSHPVISVLNRLTEAVKDLENMEDVGLKGLITIRDIIDKNDISSFELIHSGLVSKLEQYLSVSQKDSKPLGMVPLEKRSRTFLHVFVGCPIEVTPDVKPNNFDIPLFEKLIEKLNACVSHLEQFPVKVYDQPSSGNTGRPGSSIMKFFNMHQLKCLFQRHPSCTTLRQWQSGPVMIDPLASVHNVDRYLVNQGYGTLKEDDESESDLSYDDSSDEDGGLIVADIRMDHGHGTPKLQFLIGKNVLPYNMTLYQAVRQYGSGDGQASNLQLECEYPVGYASVWMKTHTIWYRPIPEGAAEGAAASTAAEGISSGAATASTSKKKSPSSRSSGKSADKSKSKSKKDVLWDNGVIPEVTFPSSFTSKLSGFDSIKDPSLGVIVLLRLIHGLSCHWGLLHKKLTWSSLVPQTAFINNELTLKVNRQLQDPFAVMTGNTPSWLSHIAYNFPFLFPFETRHLLFYVTSFDRERALQRLLDTVPELTNTEKMTPRLERRKRTVSRHSLLKQAEVILLEHGDSKALLEIQYKNEVGTGLGPTLEFYALVSKELQRADLDMWRAQEVVPGEDQSQSYVHCPFGLFPMPVPRNARSSSLAKVCNKFKLLGKFLAKAIMDSRLVDIPLSLAFYKWMLNQEKYLSLGDLQLIDESLAHNITKMSRVLTKKKKLESENSVTEEALKHKLGKLTLEGCPIEDLGLDFTLPGYPRIELKKGGKDLNVSIHNLEDYLKLIKYWTMSEGVSKQMRAFKEGFDSVFSLNRLQVFYPYELPSLFCGEVHDKWDAQMLSESCRPDHGYTLESQAIKFLFEILCNYSSLQQRQFIQFITGSPRLPIGGFKSLTPPLTIVRKTSEDDAQSDHYLPSVMTCVNYLKLPDYSSIEIMREKLQIAISEGQRSFHLS